MKRILAVDDAHPLRRLTVSALSIPALTLALLALVAPVATPRGASRSPDAHARVAAPLTDANIAAIFDAANTFDIETGQIAAEKGSAKDVRDFGTQLARDHAVVRSQGSALVKKLGVSAMLPEGSAMVAGLAKDHVDAMQKLRATERGPGFDRAFLEHEVAYHQAVIDAVTSTLLPAIQNAELRTLVTTVAPNFQAHKLMAQSLLDRLR